MRTQCCRRVAPPFAMLLSLVVPPVAAETPPDGKVPVTTTSEEARKFYLQGRDLFERIRATDAREFFRKAVAKDEGFALAHLGLAVTAPSNKEFFDSLKTAVAVADKASDAERLMIKGFDAGVRSDPAGQKAQYEKLVASFPMDERALNFLGNYHFGRQEYEEAIRVFEKAVAVNPKFSPPYNLMGYSYRFMSKYDQAERAFKKYIELIPDDPNPYDSYAELLMKMGRFQDSILNYRKALAIDPNFAASYVGIGLNQIYQGQADEARATYATLEGKARSSGEKRQALLRTAQSHLYEGTFDKALDVAQRMYAVAEGLEDKAAMAGDLNLMGNMLLEAGRPDAAREKFAESLALSEHATTPDEVKQAARRGALFSDARVALSRADVATAKAKAREYANAVADAKVPFEVRQSHEIAGLIALHERDHATAVTELRLANQQDPRVLYHLARAYKGQGDPNAARESCKEAAEHNGLNFNHAFVRNKARKMLGEN